MRRELSRQKPEGEPDAALPAGTGKPARAAAEAATPMQPLASRPAKPSPPPGAAATEPALCRESRRRRQASRDSRVRQSPRGPLRRVRRPRPRSPLAGQRRRFQLRRRFRQPVLRRPGAPPAPMKPAPAAAAAATMRSAGRRRRRVRVRPLTPAAGPPRAPPVPRHRRPPDPLPRQLLRKHRRPPERRASPAPPSSIGAAAPRRASGPRDCEHLPVSLRSEDFVAEDDEMEADLPAALGSSPVHNAQAAGLQTRARQSASRVRRRRRRYAALAVGANDEAKGGDRRRRRSTGPQRSTWSQHRRAPRRNRSAVPDGREDLHAATPTPFSLSSAPPRTGAKATRAAIGEDEDFPAVLRR